MGGYVFHEPGGRDMAEDHLVQGIAASKAGNRQEARRLLSAAIRAAPNDERTWGWFYTVCENDEERLRCLKEVLRINPNNPAVKMKYDELAGRTSSIIPSTQAPAPQAQPAKTLPPETVQTHTAGPNQAIPPETVRTTLPQTPPAPPKSNEPSRTKKIGKNKRLIVSAVIGVGLVCLFCLVAIIIGITNRKAAPAATIPQSIGGTPTAVTNKTLPTDTPVMTFTPTIFYTSTLTFTSFPSFTPAQTLTITPTLSPFTADCVPRNTKREIATVVGITDGDTITVEIDGQKYKLRYIGIDTPEINESFFNESKAANATLVSGKQVLLVKDTSETDRYDRLLRYVFVGDIFVNNNLVKEGYALANNYPPDTNCSSFFEGSEDSARLAMLGIWFPTPIPRVILPQPTSPGGSAGSAVCDCSGNLYNCDHFSSHNEAQACFNYCISQGVGDIHHLDGDSNGLACESLP
jgi:endonuclease YncB( thermonuclease family)